MIDDDLLSWIRDATEHAESWSAASRALAARDPDGQDGRLRPFVLAFGYTLFEQSSDRRSRAGSPFGAMVSGDGWQFPPPLEEISDDDVRVWSEAFEVVNDPIARSRLGDLLWERRAQPRPDLAAGAAADALLEVAATSGWHIMERVRCLSRALEIARATNDAERQRTIIERILAVAEDDLASESGGPGVPLGALEPVVDLPPEDRPAQLDDLLGRVADHYGEDPFIFDSVAELRARLIGAEQREQLRRDQVQRWRMHAGQGDVLLRVHALEHALEIARTYGLRSEAEDLRRELGNIRPQDLGLREVSAEIEVPQEEVEKFLARFDDAPDWTEALRLLAAHGPPGGAPEELEDEVEAVMQRFPLQFLFKKVLIGPDNATSIFRAAGHEAHKRLAVAEERGRQARLWSIYYAEALDRIGARADRPDRAALSCFFTTDLIEPEVAERIARAVELFWDGQYDESAHVLVPRLERVLREVARQLGLPVVREPRPDREIGGVEMLGALLRDLHDAFSDPGWHAYLFNVLADPLGLNLRNSIAHGLHGTVGKLDDALLVHAALVLAGMRLRPVESPPEPPPGSAPVG